MSDFLFDVPWWIPTVLALLGVVTFWNGKDRDKTGLRNAGLSLVVLAAGWFCLSYFVDTDKEKAQRGTEQLVDMVTHGKWDEFRNRLSPTVTFRVQGGSNVYAEGADQLTEYAKMSATAIQLQSAYVQSTQVEQIGTIITVKAHISSSQNAANFPPTATSSFEFDWELAGSGWVVRDIRIVQIFNIGARDLESMMRTMPGK